MASLGVRAGYRLGQFGRALDFRVPHRDRALAAALLTPAQLAAFHLMGSPDRRHAARVTRALQDAGARDPDLLVAALLHDLGKVDAAGRGRVRLPHRVSKVLLARLAPWLWRWAGGRARRGPTRGYYLLQQHPALGAAWAARLGVSPRACALIAAHQEGPGRSVGVDATLLRQLRAADDRN